MYTVDSNPAKKARNEATSNILPQQQQQSFLHDDNTCLDYIPASFLAPRPKRYVFRLVPEEPHQQLTTHTGQKLYMRMISEESIQQKVNHLFLSFFIFSYLMYTIFLLLQEMALLSSNKPGKLLKISVQAMKQQLENEVTLITFFTRTYFLHHVFIILFI